MYSDLTARVISDTTGTYFNIQKGVRQGDPLSPVLFNCALEEVFRRLNWTNEGIDINGSRLNNLRYADDITLIATNLPQLKNMLLEY